MPKLINLNASIKIEGAALNRNHYLTVGYDIDDEDYNAIGYHAVALHGKSINPSGNMPVDLLIGTGSDLKGHTFVVRSRFLKIKKIDVTNGDDNVVLNYNIKLEEGDTLIWHKPDSENPNQCKDAPKEYQTIYMTTINFI